MNAREAAHRLGITVQQVRFMVRKGRLPLRDMHKNAFRLHIADIKKEIHRRRRRRDLRDAWILDGGASPYSWVRSYKRLYIRRAEDEMGDEHDESDQRTPGDGNAICDPESPERFPGVSDLLHGADEGWSPQLRSRR